MALRDELNGYLKLPEAFWGIPPPTSGEPDVGILGVPHDLTSSYLPGCRFAPREIRKVTTSRWTHSHPLTVGYDEFREFKPLTEMLTLEDIGDLEIELRQPEQAMYDMAGAAERLASSSSSIYFIGGDHYITYPLIKGLKKGTSGEYGIVYLDAHADFNQDYGGYQLSHATTLRRILDDGIVMKKNILAHDLRSAPPDHRKELADGDDVTAHTLGSFSDAIQDIAERTDYIYVSIDIDVLKPDVAPGISHPEAGGLELVELLEFMRACFETGRVKYADLVELNPMRDPNNIAAVAGREITKEVLTGFAYHKWQSE
ncbi:MAG: arginase family protein [Candidatus Thorarchaeota archaeon]|nr:arginase family protein [Candidatus Thorarchaeota archaeon]